jgi:hypothetical protein
MTVAFAWTSGSDTLLQFLKAPCYSEKNMGFGARVYEF